MKRSSFAVGAVLSTGSLALGARAVVAEAPSLGSWVERVEVEHLPDRIATRARLTPQALATYPDVVRRTFGASPVVERLVAAARAASTTARHRPGAFDCRWLVTFSGDGRQATIATDAFGRRGSIDGEPVDLDGAALLSALRTEDPTLAS